MGRIVLCVYGGEMKIEEIKDNGIYRNKKNKKLYKV